MTLLERKGLNSRSVRDYSINFIGEDSLSYGYDSSGKSCSASNFSDYGVTFTEGDVIGCYLVSSWPFLLF